MYVKQSLADYIRHVADVPVPGAEYQDITPLLHDPWAFRDAIDAFAAYYESAGRVDLMELHPDEKPVFISGSKVREALLAGERPDPRILRPEIADILIEYYKSK